LADLVKERTPKANPKTAGWPRTFDLINRRDGRDWPDIEAALEFAFRDDNGFVVLSPDSLRRKFDNLTVHMERAKKADPYAGARKDVTQGNLDALATVLSRNGGQ
jgi:hypothetical protein